MLRVTLQDVGDWRALAERWQALEAVAAPSFFQSWAWVGCLAEARYDDPVLMEATRDGAVVGLALFNRRRGRLWLHETGRPGWDSVFVEHNGPLLGPAEGAETRRRCLAVAGVVTLSGVDPATAAAAPGAVIAAQTRLAPYVGLAGWTPDRLSANTRQALRRSARCYGALAISRAANPAQAHDFLDRLAVLHQATWTARGKPGAFARAEFARFHHALIDRTQAVDLLRITAGDQVVGYLLNFRLRGRVSAYQSGFDYAAAGRHAKPGMTCHLLAIERYVSEGMSVYDFLGGDDRYKTSLATGSAPLLWVTSAPKWSLAWMAGWVRRGGKAIGRKPHVVAGFMAMALGAAAPLPGVVLQGDRAAAARMVTFGQVFLAGQVPPGSGLAASAGGKPIAAQLDVKAAYPDGSARIGVVTLAAHGAASIKLAPAPAPTVTLDLAGAAYDLAVDLVVGGTRTHIDAAALLARAMAVGAPYWLRGPLASEARIDAPVTGALHVVFDVRAYSDGSTCTDVQFRNDIAMGAAGGALTYDATIRLGGRAVAQALGVHHFQYQSWHRVVCSNGPPTLNIQHDIAALERTGLIANYDLTTGVAPKVLAEQVLAATVPGWGAPLAANGVTRAMPGTGGRPDIGPTTRANAVWLVTQSAAAAAFALGQADAAGAVPWQFWDAAAGTWLNTDAHPTIWIDERGGSGGASGLTQPVDPASGWVPDTAHQPDLSFVAYLLTGSRRALDLLNAQAAFSIVAAWPDPSQRGGAEANVIRGNQLRGAAWSLRQIDEAAWANPAGSREAAYFGKVAAANWRWLAAQLPDWSRQEGQTAGYILGSEYREKAAFPPWQQDYFVATAVQAAEQGNADALAYLHWADNFVAGRFLNGAAGFNPRNGASYLIGNRLDGALCTSWAQLQQATVAAGEDNGAGWAHSDGDYAALALASLAGMVTATGSPRALAAYRWLQAAGAPYTDAAARQTDVQFAIVPRMGR